MSKLALFASGSGTNAENIIRYARSNPQSDMQVVCIIYNRKDAYVRVRAEKLGIPAEYLPDSLWADSKRILSTLERYDVDVIILAGWLSRIPEYLINAYPERIVNIHPALLPDHGGKGMYSMRVHEAVKAAGDSETGITIHVIDTEYDRGRTIFRAKVGVLPEDSPETIAAKVHELEYKYYPSVIEDWLTTLPSNPSHK